MFRSVCYAAGLAAILNLAVSPASAQPPAVAPTRESAPAQPGSDPADYIRLARLADHALMVVDVTVREAMLLKREASAAPRLYLSAATNALIRGNETLDRQIAFLAAPSTVEANTSAAKQLRKSRLLLFARPVAGRPGEVQLVAPDAYVMWTPERDATVRAIIGELLGPDATPAITQVTSAFHVPGSVAGEGETQIFLATASGRPASLFVRRSADASVHWGAAFGEVVTQTAEQPRPRTLAWYRLACGLPETLPAAAFADAHEDRRVEVERDYRYVREQLGACPAG